MNGSTSVGNVLLLTDADGRVTSAGGPTSPIFGSTPAELIGKDLSEIVGMGVSDLTAATGAGRSDRIELTLPSPARHESVAIMTLELAPGPGLGVIISPATGTELDRTREANMALTASNRQLEAFASVAAHDLQEPIRKIRAFSDRVRLVLADGETEGATDYLDRIDGAAIRMQTLISDLLGLARVAGQTPDRRRTGLDAVLDEVRNDLADQIAATGAELDVEDLPVVVGDPVLLHQLFLNLIGNSLKYRHPDRTPRITITAAQDEDTVTITVSDNGIGFDDQYLSKIFEPFERLWGRDHYPGTGVGLALCREIVHRHGGTITAHGHPGAGADFMVELPQSGA
ncbi:MAG: ATP-binding protein [Acidimicrobiia bacterium]|nr:ATP-binding protein [Acidimicrobiia bacterium]